MKPDALTIGLGPLAPPIRQQLTRAGRSIKPKDAEFLQRLADAITLLEVDYISVAVAKLARQRLTRRVARESKPIGSRP